MSECQHERKRTWLKQPGMFECLDCGHQQMPDPYEQLATGIEQMRESLRAMIAGLMSDGFSEAQAREIVVAIHTRKVDDDA